MVNFNHNGPYLPPHGNGVVVHVVHGNHQGRQVHVVHGHPHGMPFPPSPYGAPPQPKLVAVKHVPAHVVVEKKEKPRLVAVKHEPAHYVAVKKVNRYYNYG